METANQVIKCLAAIAWEPKKPLSFEEIEVAPPKAHEVRIKILYSGLCHTDTFTIDGENPFCVFPCILGHEGSGIVESVGECVTNVAPGDHVVPSYLPNCGECKCCTDPELNLCKFFTGPESSGLMRDGTTRFTCKGKPIRNYMGCSTFSQYTVVPDIAVAKISPEAPLEKVCLFGCGISTGYGTAINIAKIKEGDTVAIWGLGGVGLSAIMGAKEMKAKTIVAIDINPKKFEKALQYGATECLNPKDLDLNIPFQHYLKGKYDGGFDCTIECTGNPQAMQEALESVHPGWGVACMIGVTDKNVSTMGYNILYARAWKGSIFGGWKLLDVPKLVEKHLEGKIDLDGFITHRFALKELNEAVELLHQGTRLIGSKSGFPFNRLTEIPSKKISKKRLQMDGELRSRICMMDDYLKELTRPASEGSEIKEL